MKSVWSVAFYGNWMTDHRRFEPSFRDSSTSVSVAPLRNPPHRFYAIVTREVWRVVCFTGSGWSVPIVGRLSRYN